MADISGRKLLLSIDPGDKTGIAIFDYTTCEILRMKIYSDSEMTIFLRSLDASQVVTVVIEDFILYANKAKEQTGSRFKAIQVIGMLRMWCDLHGIPLIKQPATILTNGYKIAGIKRQSNHANSHHYDAVVHGVVYFINRGRKVPESYSETVT